MIPGDTTESRRGIVFQPHRRWVFFLEACIVVTLLGLLLTVTGARDGWVGLAACAFFSPGIPISLAQIFKRRPVTRDRSRFVIAKSSWGAVSYLFLCAGWIVGGVLLLKNRPETAPVTLALIGICAFGLFISLWQFFDRRPLMVIDDEGFLDASLGIGVIPWSEITGAAIETVQGTDVIALQLKNPEKLLSQRTKSQEWISRINQVVGFELLHLGIVRIDAAYLDEALDFILARCGDSHQEDSFADVMELGSRS